MLVHINTKKFALRRKLLFTDILCSSGHGSLKYHNEFVSIKTDFQQVVNEREKRTQRESRHKKGNKTILDH